MESIRRLVEAAIVGSPFARQLGVRALALEPDRARLGLAFRPELVTVGDMVHGGAIAGLIDIGATAACWCSAGSIVFCDVEVAAAGRTAPGPPDHRAGGAMVARASVTYKLSGGAARERAAAAPSAAPIDGEPVAAR